MKQPQKVTDKIERYAINLPSGSIVTSEEVAAKIGGRRATRFLVSSVFKGMDELEHIKDYNGGRWMRK